MLSRDDFIFTIGYDGPMAIIDGQAKKRYHGLSTEKLIEKGLFRAAYSSAVYSNNQEEIKQVADAYSQLTGTPVNLSSMDRLFGVFPMEVNRSLIL